MGSDFLYKPPKKPVDDVDYVAPPGGGPMSPENSAVQVCHCIQCQKPSACMRRLVKKKQPGHEGRYAVTVGRNSPVIQKDIKRPNIQTFTTQKEMQMQLSSDYIE